MSETKGPTPSAGYKARTTGSHQVPENAKPNYTGSVRGQYPKGSVPTPERTKPRFTGSSQDAGIPKRGRTAPVVTREGKGHGTPAGSTKSPWTVPSSKSKI
jgi:hypothetical protein